MFLQSDFNMLHTVKYCDDGELPFYLGDESSTLFVNNSRTNQIKRGSLSRSSVQGKYGMYVKGSLGEPGGIGNIKVRESSRVFISFWETHRSKC